MAIFSRRKPAPTFDLGPQGEAIKQLVRTFDALPDYQVTSLTAQTLDAERRTVIDDGGNAPYAGDVRDFAGRTAEALWRARDAARAADREHTFTELPRRFEKHPPALTAASLAARGLFVRDLIADTGFTTADYDLLTGPWRRVIGPLHDEDDEAPTAPASLTHAWDLSLDG
ncbi:hypothetical protein [Curtobacterium sp. MCBD17_040]|uniref:hypothetical protein n=1 Tax=Curtobacterium sp. MCBD17_040 TaxID=2175674 RepID=UPI0011B3E793|nr:hypothetical protein [Curtobacterium sp. MCBD17_040]WIB65342.1 hypothetical protein DEI94_18215 [Curtobacterium sp. MCBD17_040]